MWGIVEEDEGRMRGKMGGNGGEGMEMGVMWDGEEGKEGVRDYEVVEGLGYVRVVKWVVERGGRDEIGVEMKEMGDRLFNDEG